MTDLINAVILGIVEGLTEFLPVSSTGHMVLCEWGMGIDLDTPHSFWKLFTVFIQMGAILAVVVYFRRRIMDLLLGRGGEGEAVPQSPLLKYWAVWMVLLATVPVLVVGYLLHKQIEAYLGSPLVIIAALAIGGVAMIVIERLELAGKTGRIEDISWKQAVGIGLAQILAAVFPGTSRAAATIMGGMVAGLSRPAATEFSFYLAIPALCAASAYQLLKNLDVLTRDNLLLLAIGTLVSFLVAWVVIAAFMSYVRHRTFVPFAVYRLLLALVVGIWYWSIKSGG